MARGFSVLLMLAGAIIYWGVTADYEDINEDALGIILMIVGGAGTLLTLVADASGRHDAVR